ncbi:MAG: ester cyclase [Luteimonas sp.]|nr:ester cyclase [Luteimonas sp.]
MRKLLLTGLTAATLVLSAAVSAGPVEDKLTASRVLLEKMGQGKFEISDEIYGPGFVAHGFGRDYSLEEDNASGRALRAAFPDLKVAVDRTVAEGDLVAVHWSSSGSNSVKTESFPGNGKTVAIDGMTFFRFKDGRIVEEWTTYDNLSLMKQLGMLPAK